MVYRDRLRAKLYNNQKPMDDGRRYHRDEVYVRDWDTFKKVWKSTDFIKTMSQLTPEQSRQKFRQNLIDLIKHDTQQCLVFNEHLKPEHLNTILDLVKSEEFNVVLDFQHEGMFLGKAKQLIVYKKRASVATYLAKYRPPTEYKNLLSQILQIGKELQKLVIDKNVKISLQSPNEQIQACAAKILAFRNEKVEAKLKLWRDLVNRMFEDFKSQPKKEEMLYLGVNSLIYQELRLLCQKYELYIGNRYQNISDSDEYRDISITKYDRNNSSQFDDNSAESLNSNEAMEPEGEVILDEEKQIQIQVPKDIKSVTLRGFSQKGAICLIQIASFGIINPVNYIRIRLQSPQHTEQQKNYEQRIQISHGEFDYEVVLPCLADGCSAFEISTVNEVGACKKPQLLKVWMQGTKEQQADQAFPKLQYVNHCLYILGENEQGLIPNWNSENNNIIRTTEQQWSELKFAGSQFSVSTHATICNKQGQVASWGKMYYFDEAGEFQDEKQQADEEDDLGLSKQLRPETFRTQPPSLILDSKFIRKVSCGDGYCLMADSLGKVWSFGINTFGQLGLEHTSQNIDTSEPTLIPYFATNSNIFVVDVAASYFGASFAIDDKGKAYRWGTNQIEQSNRPVKDSYNNIINFQYPDIVAAQSVPAQISIRLISDKIKSIHPGFQFVLALTETEKVYGWGKTKFLGLGTVEDAHFKQIDNFCNPVHILDNIKGLQVGINHCLALSTKNELLGWGQCKYYQIKDKQGGLICKPQVVIENAASVSCKCGPNFTAYYFEQKNEIKVIGNKQIFKVGTYELPCRPIKIQAGEGIIMVLGKQLPKPQPDSQAQLKKEEEIKLGEEQKQ